MALPNRFLPTTAFLAAALVPATAQDRKPDELTPKEALHARLIELAREIESHRARGANDYQVSLLTQEYVDLSSSMGGDDPGRLLGAPDRTRSASTPPASQQSLVAAPPACGATPVTASFAGTTGSIGTPAVLGTATFTVLVSSPDTYLWDVNLTTFMTHTECADLDITLTSPAGTTVVITTDNGGTNDNVFNGTLWDDNVNDPATDRTYVNLTTATPLSPEGRLEAFRGENPNGLWTLTVVDDLNTDVGTLTSWSLDVVTLPSAPTPTTTTFTSTPGTVIPTTAPPNIFANSIVTSGLGTYLAGATLYLELPHTFPGDLDITLTSPVGTVVTVTTDNGGGSDNVFNGTLFDPNVLDTATDHVYANLVVATPLSPEGSFDNFLGQDPNGTWTLTVSDDASGDGGTIVRWDLALTTIAAPTPSAPTNVPGTGGAVPDTTTAVSSGTFTFTASVSGLPTSLWDADLNTAITHTFSSDLDITLTSPAGTAVVITTDNGGGNDNCFNGTSWDDNVNVPAVDFTYANLVTANPLSPEGRLAAFRGEDPNGTWTLTIVDDLGGDLGDLNGWSLDLAALPGAPAEVSTTLTQSPNLTMVSPGSNTDMILAAGLGTSITEIEVYLEVVHTNAADLDITLTSPAGTIVQLTTDNGGTNDNVYNGTRFDADVLDPVTDHVYTNLVVVPLLAPEGSFDNFLGQDPNGTWTLDVADDTAAGLGTFVRWDLTIRTCGAPAPTAFCFGDGAGTPCPCGNSGTAGNGCANSINPSGANLTSTGASVLSSDSLVLLGTGMPNSSALYFQGTAQLGGGLGVAFGDGLRCAGGSIIRLSTKSNVSGASQYPAVGDPSVSVRGLVAAPGVRTYQVWYRNAAAFCTVSTFNLTNGLEVTWVP